MNDKFKESASLINSANARLVSMINNRAPRGSDTVTVKGRHPLWTVALKNNTQEEPAPSDIKTWALQMFPTGVFSNGRIRVGSVLYEPKIGANPVSDGPSLTLQAGGGIVYFKIDFSVTTTWNIFTLEHDSVAGDIEVTLITQGANAPWPTSTYPYLYQGAVDTPKNFGTIYAPLLIYDSSGRIVSYLSQNIINTSNNPNNANTQPVSEIFVTVRAVA
jgi:hypothetical protein